MSAQQQPFEIPRELLEAINQARPTCWWYQKGQCKKGSKCQNRHEPDTQDKIPHVSCIRTESGEPRLCIRPKLPDAWAVFEKNNKSAATVYNAKMISDDMILYQTKGMLGVDRLSCDKTKTRGFVEYHNSKEEKWKHPSRVQARKLPTFLIHGTSPTLYLDISRDRHVKASPGVCGVGVYGFELEDLDNETVVKQIERTRTGGYFKGAAVILKTDGILINSLGNTETVPPGAIAYDNKTGQFAAHPGSVEPIAVVFSQESLCAALCHELNSVG